MFKNTLDNKRYYTLNYYYKKKYNSKVFKVSLNGGFTCPNKDGTVGTRGCIFCSRLGSGDFAGNKNLDLISQFNEVKSIMLKKWPDAKYIGYFQANTNTYAPLDQLKAKYETILNLDNVVGLNIATRSDSITDEVMDYLEELKLTRQEYLSLKEDAVNDILYCSGMLPAETFACIITLLFVACNPIFVHKKSILYFSV